MHRLLAVIALSVPSALLVGCDADDDDSATAGITCAEGAEGDALAAEDPGPAAAAVGYEILEIVSLSEIKAWAGMGITQEQFDAIELPAGWLKNQPRQIEMDGGSFARSPDAEADGEFDDAELFDLPWRHVATTIEANVALDPDALLRRNTIRKHHAVRFEADRTLTVLISPDDERYVRITRDAGRTSDDPTLPDGWRQVVCHTPEAIEFDLPNPTINIRGDNEDSWQGPVTLDLPL